MMADIVMMALADIHPYENNPRVIKEDAVKAVAASIRNFGWQQPIVVDKDNVIIVGHTRYKAAQYLGLDKAPVLVADDLDEAKVKEYRIADNKVAEYSTWNYSALLRELLEVFDMDMTQFGFAGKNDAPEEGGGMRTARSISDCPRPASSWTPMTSETTISRWFALIAASASRRIDMEIIQADPRKLKPYENNPRVNDKTVEYLMKSIQRYGFRQPIVVDEDMVVLAGHTRLKAALRLNLKTVPVVIAIGLTEEQRRAYRLADNKTADITGWADDLLKAEAEGLDGLVDFGIDYGDIEPAASSGSPGRSETTHTHVCPRCKHEF